MAPPPPAGTPLPPAGGLKKLEGLHLCDTQINNAGCDALVAALDSGALPALDTLKLTGMIAASDEAKAAVSKALARLPAHESLTLQGLRRRTSQHHAVCLDLAYCRWSLRDPARSARRDGRGGGGRTA